ncbi:MAG: hypothetical protein HZA46_12950 [Planctomycetales bacterium]|nr:hypothetical protein [Planctomycetales bacterium]
MKWASQEADLDRKVDRGAMAIRPDPVCVRKVDRDERGNVAKVTVVQVVANRVAVQMVKARVAALVVPSKDHVVQVSPAVSVREFAPANLVRECPKVLGAAILLVAIRRTLANVIPRCSN